MKFILAHNCTNGAFELDILLSQNCHFWGGKFCKIYRFHGSVMVQQDVFSRKK